MIQHAKPDFSGHPAPAFVVLSPVACLPACPPACLPAHGPSEPSVFGRKSAGEGAEANVLTHCAGEYSNKPSAAVTDSW